MRVSHLSLTSWRNFRTAELELTPGVTVLIGQNGQGKTNLVEAIGYLSTLSSHRVSAPHAVIRSGDESAVIRALLQHEDRMVRAELQLNRSTPNRAQLGGAPAKPRELTRYCHSVMFAPEDLAIVRGDPSDRRRFLDELLVQLSPRLAGVFADYDRVVKQRTNLLKTARGLSSVSTLEIWNDKLIDLGSEIVAERLELVARLNPKISTAYRQIVDADHSPQIMLARSSGSVDAVSDELPRRDRAQIAVELRAALAEVYPTERERGQTLIGPHRDELTLRLNELPVKGYASHGESWSFALALKLAAAEVLRETSQVGDPVLILDDVFAELDRSRRDRLANAVAAYEQVIITAAVVEDVPEQLSAQQRFVRAGELSATPWAGQ